MLDAAATLNDETIRQQVPSDEALFNKRTCVPFYGINELNETKSRLLINHVFPTTSERIVSE